MAQKRMFSLTVVDTDRFLDMSVSAQALYFHLGLHADDDGFVAAPRKIARAAGCNDDDLRLLSAKRFIIPFESGVVVLTDWNINNTLKSDRYHATIFLQEKAMLTLEPSGRYVIGTNLEPTWNQVGTRLEPTCIQSGADLEPEHSIVETNIVESNIVKTNKDEVERADKPPRARSKFVPPSVADVVAYCAERKNSIDPEHFVSYYEARGWKYSGGVAMKDWKAAVRNWEGREKTQKGPGSDMGAEAYQTPESQECMRRDMERLEAFAAKSADKRWNLPGVDDLGG